MALIYRTGNVVDALLNGEVDYIAHCCNAKGKYASGVAKEIRSRIPSAYNKYISSYNICALRNTLDHFLGTANYAGGVFNLVAQEYYGYDGKRYVNYGALASSLMDIFYIVQNELDKNSLDITIGIPYKMASDRAGGDWDIVLELVEHLVVPYFKDVIVYKLEG